MILQCCKLEIEKTSFSPARRRCRLLHAAHSGRTAGLLQGGVGLAEEAL